MFTEIELATFRTGRSRRTEFRDAEDAPAPAEAKVKNTPVRAEVEELRAETLEWEIVTSAIMRVVQKFPEVLKEVLAAVAATNVPCPA